MSEEPYYRELPDGTIKQVNPFTGTKVWTVPGRGARPLSKPPEHIRELTEHDRRAACAFCPDNLLSTPPEKTRLVKRPGGLVCDHDLMRCVPADQLNATVAEFRRVPNLFEILSWQYWQLNWGMDLPRASREWQEEYLSNPAGEAHVRSVLNAKFTAIGSDQRAEDLNPQELRAASAAFFAGGHDVIIAKRHYTDDGTTTADLAGSGSLSVNEHRAFMALTVDSMVQLHRHNKHVRYVVAFQNWLKPAGASFDHLHKQLVAIDEVGADNESVLPKAVLDPDLFNRWGPDFAVEHGLVLARNEGAVMTVGFGHRYPSVEVWSTSRADQPWRVDPDGIDAVSDLLHAAHVAVGDDVPANEEWHYRPLRTGVPVPWRIILKLRVSTLAGFEGGTKIYVNTISPATLAAMLLPKLFEAREAGRIAAMDLGEECVIPRGVLASTKLG
ncbi:DUF4921 family protein [Cutibacterium sp.]|uniref:DUF4921 family protein n=1 Tax=Cutibacterium sp. TaxID=1912221 RepID=UPI0026DCA382|nr:DUF4921 family protein [Cutibacterium sp.]MDO4412447.1 DUF4921 family protein [Cutibacterium sp.]